VVTPTKAGQYYFKQGVKAS